MKTFITEVGWLVEAWKSARQSDMYSTLGKGGGGEVILAWHWIFSCSVLWGCAWYFVGMQKYHIIVSQSSMIVVWHVVWEGGIIIVFEKSVNWDYHTC